MLRTVGLVGASVCVLLAIFVVVRGWRRPLDHLVVVAATLAASLLIEVPGGSWVVGLGGGLSVAILANFALRASIPHPGMHEPHSRASLPTIALIWSELPLAIAAAFLWAREEVVWGSVFLGLALSSVAINILRVLQLEGGRYWPPTDASAAR